MGNATDKIGDIDALGMGNIPDSNTSTAKKAREDRKAERKAALKAEQNAFKGMAGKLNPGSEIRENVKKAVKAAKAAKARKDKEDKEGEERGNPMETIINYFTQ